jgi:hypothetical protein
MCRSPPEPTIANIICLPSAEKTLQIHMKNAVADTVITALCVSQLRGDSINLPFLAQDLQNMHNIPVMCTFMGHKWVQGGPLGPPETSKRTLGWTFGAMKMALVLGVSLNLLALNYTVMVGEKKRC